MKRTAEQALVERARSGSLDAFDELMRHHQDRLHRFVLVRGASRADAEDIVQDTFLAAWRNLAGYRPRWRFSTWLYTIARRQASRRMCGAPVPLEELVDPAERPEAAAAAGEQRDNLWPLARRLLSREQFTALWLYYGEDRNTREVARILHRSSAWVKINLHRSRKRLADALPAEDWSTEEANAHE